MLLFLSESPGGHAISRQKPRVPFGLPYLLIELFYIGIPAVRTDVGRMDVRSRDYQNFSDAYITIINQITVKPIKTKAQEGLIHDAHKKTAWRTDPFYKFR